MLLSRDEFRQTVFERDKYHCVTCKFPGQDAHHILERRLFDDGGYYLDNGATLCADCHLKAEMTLISCEIIRAAAGITEISLPLHLEPDCRYDKWGNPILPSGQRLRGELFFDESVQKALAQGQVLGLFTSRVKYPRTFHLPWSSSVTTDDRVIGDCGHFVGKEVVVTVKMDGEQITMYTDYLHARSLDWERHPTRSWVANLHGRIGWQIPEDWRICGENLYARHSIPYTHLPDYFLVFSVWDERNMCLSWADTEEWTALLGLKTVPVLYRGIWQEGVIRELFQPTWNGDPMEGYVVRLAEDFPYSQFRRSVAKYVRAGHVQTSHHWRYQPVIPNKLATDEN